MAVTLDEACECPHCHNQMKREVYGRVTREMGGGTVYTTTCETEGCRWYGTGRIIQTNGDGQVYERPGAEAAQSNPETNWDKSFPAMSPSQMAMGRRAAEEAAQQDLEEELPPNG